MRKFIEKLFISLACLYNIYRVDSAIDFVLYFLVSIIISLAVDLISERKYRIVVYFVFMALCLYNDLFIFYLPVILYNMYIDLNTYTVLILPIIFTRFAINNLALSIISIYLAAMAKKYNMLLEENKIVRDELKEDTLTLEKYNRQLRIDREKNIHIAILTERNRIARRLHDSIGHAISSSILQVEALKIVSNDENFVEELTILQNTLSSGMDDIRRSIHNLYNESLDLEREVERLCSGMPSIEVRLLYRIDHNLSYDLKFDILSVVKEAMTNCVKHSNATRLKISLIEHPKFYSIVIEDNGSKVPHDPMTTRGIGLSSMSEIAGKYNGFLNYKFDNGFKVHLTLMKG